jgi:hypothetical protein
MADIVLSDRNLHAAFLCHRAFDGLTAKALGPWRTVMYNSGAAGTRGEASSPDICQGSIPKACLPIGTVAANWRERGPR